MVPRRLRAQRSSPPGRLSWPGRRRGARGVAFGALAALVIVAAACSSSDSGDGTSDRTTTTSPSTSGSPSVTIGIICSTPADAAQSFEQAWEGDDRAAAARCASEAAVTMIFRNNGRNADWSFEGCGGPDPGVPTCFYRYEGGGATFTIMGTEAAGWKVTKIEFTAD